MLTDICIIIVFALFVLNSYKKGFIKSIYSILSLVATVAIVSLFKDTLVKAIAQSQFGVAIGELLAGSNANPAIIALCSENIVYFISVIAFYLILRIVIKFALAILNSIASLPVINSLNKILGLIIGFFIGALWIVVILNVLANIPQTAPYIESSNIANYFKIIFI